MKKYWGWINNIISLAGPNVNTHFSTLVRLKHSRQSGVPTTQKPISHGTQNQILSKFINKGEWIFEKTTLKIAAITLFLTVDFVTASRQFGGGDCSLLCRSFSDLSDPLKLTFTFVSLFFFSSYHFRYKSSKGTNRLSFSLHSV